MNKEKKGLFLLLGLLTGVVLLTACVIRSYNNQSPDQYRSRREPEASPQVVRGLLNESARFFTQERYPEAEHSLRRVLNLDRDNIMAMRMLGNVYFLSGRYFEASNIFRAVLAKHPGDPVAHANLGETLVRLKWYEAGIRELLTARAIDPNQPDIDMSLSRAYEELGDLAAAEEYRRKASERNAEQEKSAGELPPQNENQETEPSHSDSPEQNHEQD